jgi:hypothetical protein
MAGLPCKIGEAQYGSDQLTPAVNWADQMSERVRNTEQA